MNQPQPSANVRIYLSDEGERRSWIVPVIPETTLLQILNSIGLDPHLFERYGHNEYVFVNEGDTTMPLLDRNLLYYNNWNVENGYISSLYIKRVSQTLGW